MKQILIVDNDTSILDGISFMLERNMEGVEVTCCENGLAAWDLLLQRDFDLVITDVLMPEISGLDLIEKMYTQDRALPVVVISGYNDFSFVRRAMQFGARDYLLKPVKMQELLSAVERAFLPPQAERAANRKDTDARQASQDAASYLVSQKWKVTERIVRALACLRITNRSKVVPALLQPSVSKPDGVLDALRARLVPQCAGPVLGMVRDGAVLLMAFEVSQSAVAETLQAYAQEHAMETIHFSAGRECRIEALPTAFQALEEALAKCFFDLSLPQTASAEHALDALTQAVIELNEKRADESMDAFLGAMQTQRVTREQLIKALSNWFYALLRELPEMIRIVSRLNLTEFDFLASLQRAPSLSAMRLSLRGIVRVYIGELSNMTDRRTVQMERVKQYVREHLGGAVQISDAAALIGMHPNYLSALFKAHTNLSFRDFLRNERIDRARRLILETDMKLYEVAEAVGYPDPAHFSRAFKQATGQTPQSLIRLEKKE